MPLSEPREFLEVQPPTVYLSCKISVKADSGLVCSHRQLNHADAGFPPSSEDDESNRLSAGPESVERAAWEKSGDSTKKLTGEPRQFFRFSERTRI
jgi:hypothetical protein